MWYEDVSGTGLTTVGVGRELKLRDRGGSDMLVPCKTLFGAKVSWVQDPRFLATPVSC